MLRRVEEQSPALSDTELKERGNELVSRAREAAITAIGRSMHPEFVQRGKPLGRADLRRWRWKARHAIDAWREVESLITELLNELEKKDDQFRSSHAPVAVTDDGVHYRTEWVKKGPDHDEDA